MRISRALPLMFAALCFAACGSSSSKHPDAHVNGPDASTTPDSPPGTPDAPPGVGPGFGNSCPTTPPSGCPADVSVCAALSGSATTGWCTLTCGTNASTTTPPTGGDAICAQAFGASSLATPANGTPGCVIYDNSDPANVAWYCAIGCGTLPNNGGDLGGCPSGLTCNTTDHLCE